MKYYLIEVVQTEILHYYVQAETAEQASLSILDAPEVVQMQTSAPNVIRQLTRAEYRQKQTEGDAARRHEIKTAMWRPR